jgi:uncharacterized OB-fold protein
MTLCPRCGANNDEARAACWNCFAPLTGRLASRVKPMNLSGRGVVVEEPILEGEEPEPAPPPKKRGLFGRKKG